MGQKDLTPIIVCWPDGPSLPGSQGDLSGMGTGVGLLQPAAVAGPPPGSESCSVNLPVGRTEHFTMFRVR